jgi:hypothetical protein
MIAQDKRHEITTCADGVIATRRTTGPEAAAGDIGLLFGVIATVSSFIWYWTFREDLRAQ